jgi:hypothetical protein
LSKKPWYYRACCKILSLGNSLLSRKPWYYRACCRILPLGNSLLSRKPWYLVLQGLLQDFISGKQFIVQETLVLPRLAARFYNWETVHCPGNPGTTKLAAGFYLQETSLSRKPWYYRVQRPQELSNCEPYFFSGVSLLFMNQKN